MTVVALAHGPRSGEQHGDLDELRGLFPGADVRMVPGRTRPKRVDQLRSVVSARSWEWGRYAAREFTAEVRRHATGAVLHVDDLGAADALSTSARLKAFAPHNVEYAIVRAVAQRAGGPRRIFSELDSRKVTTEEHRAWRRADLCVAVSDLDAEAMRSGGAREVLVAENGTDPVDQLPFRTWDRDAEPLRLLFVGTASYQPNERGITWFVNEVMPLLSGRVDVVLDVVGSPPRRPVQRPDVTYAGRVPTVDAWYERSHIAVVPIFEGSGTRLKVVEAMAFGRPVVSTRLGAEGLPITADEHFAAAEDAEQFAAQILAVGSDLAAPGSGATAAQVERSRAVAVELFWPRIARRLADAYLEMTNEGETTGR